MYTPTEEVTIHWRRASDKNKEQKRFHIMEEVFKRFVGNEHDEKLCMDFKVVLH